MNCFILGDEMKKKPLVSIIVPIFNVANYVYDCLASIRNQTFNDFEVVMIDDGSTDQSNLICEQFCQLDCRFILHTQKNAGLSVARNKGIQFSSGEFILFVDPDDMLNEKLLEKTTNLLIKYGTDIVSFGYLTLNNDKLLESSYSGPDLGKINSSIALESLFSGQFGNYVWKLLVKKSIYKKNRINFPQDRQFEDVATTYKILGYARTIYFTSDRLYIYRQRKNSITHMHSDKDLQDMLITFNEIDLFIDRNFSSLKSILLNYEFNMIFMLITRMGGWDTNILNVFRPLKRNQKRYIIDAKKTLKKIYRHKKNSKLNKKKQWIKFFLLNLKVFPICIAIKSSLKRG
ncbi:glycosyltransferase [Leuconostoc falkenbergense]|uniref:Glycosyltransferase n=2 Tax=Leuconostoc falkenbergense TaxID=2766470 RepID=A0A9X3INK3_9LACO|nr:glycosyltransferase [Leuconostoc falkenbergense]